MLMDAEKPHYVGASRWRSSRASGIDSRTERQKADVNFSLKI
jgi:hypothetical protein